jgi:hypothetical protein
MKKIKKKSSYGINLYMRYDRTYDLNICDRIFFQIKNKQNYSIKK